MFVLGDLNTIFYVEVDDSMKLGSGGGLQSEVRFSFSSKILYKYIVIFTA